MKRLLPTFMVMVCACLLPAVAFPALAAERRKVAPPAAVAPARSSAAVNQDMKKVSDAKLATTIAIYSPASEDTVRINQNYEIKWTRLGQMDNIVDIEAVRVGANTKFGIIGKTLNDGSFTWPVLGLTPGKYRIRIITADKAITGESNPFDVVNTAVELVSPVPGAAWYTGETHDITWKPSMLPDGATITLDFLKPDGKTLNLGNNLANSGKFTWKVSYDALMIKTYQKPGSSYPWPMSVDTNGTLKVTAIASGKTYSTERPLLLAKQSITITNPKPGETWTVGKTYTVTWEKKGAMATMATLGIWSAGFIGLPILNIQTPNSGSATVTVPHNKFFDDNPTWTNFKVQLSAAVEGTADGVFDHAGITIKK